MEIQGDEAVFSTGKRVYANRGIIGLEPDLNVHQGYDGRFDCWPYYLGDEEANVLTRNERLELADYMIDLWTKFRHADGPIEKGA